MSKTPAPLSATDQTQNARLTALETAVAGLRTSLQAVQALDVAQAATLTALQASLAAGQGRLTALEAQAGTIQAGLSALQLEVAMIAAGIKASGGTTPTPGKPLTVGSVGTVTAVTPTGGTSVPVVIPDPVVTGGTPPYTTNTDPPSGSDFPPGTTPVVITVTDSGTPPTTTTTDTTVVVVVDPVGASSGSAVSTGGLTVTATGPLTLGLVLLEGQIPSGQTVQVGSWPTQTDIKTTWGDGSARHAIVSTIATATGAQALTAIAAPGGSYTPTWPSASVACVISGVTYTAALPSFSGTDTWLNGALCREARVVVTPKTAGNTAHPLLQVIFDVRSYAAGGHRVDATVQNVRDLDTIDKVTADVTFTVAGVTIWSAAGFVFYTYTRIRLPRGTVALTVGAAEPDYEPFFQATALPRYLASIDNPTYDTSNATHWGPNGFGNMTPMMDAAGGRPEIAPFPDWAAQYLVHQRASQRAALLINGDCSGSWGAHIMQSDGISLYDVANFPTFWFSQSADPWPEGPRALRIPGNGFRGVRFGAPTFSDLDSVINEEHVPNLTYLPYLITGDRYYLDQSKIWANNFILNCPPQATVLPEPGYEPDFNRSRALGPLWRFGLTRELGHPFAVLAMAAMICPDSDADKTYFVGLVQTQLDGLSAGIAGQFLAGGITEALGWEGNISYADGTLTTPVGRYFSLWRLAYTSYALDFIDQQGVWTMNQARDFLARTARTAVGYWQHGTTGGQQVPNYVQWARVNSADTVITPIASWADLYAFNLPGFYGVGGNFTAAFGDTPIGFHGVENHVALVAGTRLGVTGAATTLAALRAYHDGFGTLLADLNTRSGYAVDCGITIPVASGGDLQAAIDAAQPGDTLVLEAGATFTGNFTLPNTVGAGYITIRTATPDAALPSVTTRINPSHASLLPTLTCASGVTLATDASAHHWRLLGLRIVDTVGQNDLVTLGSGDETSLSDIPHDLIVDRCLIQGVPAGGTKRAIALNSKDTTIINCYISGIRRQGQDSQAICGWNGPGGYLIENNYLEAASENLMIGGADPKITNLIPTNITIRGNYLYKPLAWKAESGFVVKNLLELKLGKTILIENNVFENSWADGQIGFGIVITVRNQDGTADWSTIQDVTLRYNLIKRAEGPAVSLLGKDERVGVVSVQGTNLNISNLLVVGTSTVGVNSANGFEPTILTHCTFPSIADKFLSFDNTPMPSGDFTCQNVVTGTGTFGITGDGSTGIGLPSLDAMAPGAIFSFNLLGGPSYIPWPGGNTVITADALTASLDPQLRYVGTVPSSDGLPLGCDIDGLRARIPWAVWP